MPELPEVETTRLGITPWIEGQIISHVIIHRSDLRQPISPSLTNIQNLRCLNVKRRAKYLIFTFEDQSQVLCHLGMSGSLRLCPNHTPWKKHDHVAWEISRDNQTWQLRYHDPRRFGLLLHSPFTPFSQHPLLTNLGPEPLSKTFSTTYLQKTLHARKIPIKQAIMDPKVVVGVGNIYASEALFLAKISPLRPANSLNTKESQNLTHHIRQVLQAAIAQGGTTLRDFINPKGTPGYFAQQLNVYQKTSQPCPLCQTPITQQTLAQRSTFWCPTCQT